MWQTPDQPGDACGCRGLRWPFALLCVTVLVTPGGFEEYALSIPFALSLFVTQVLLWFAWKTVMASLSSLPSSASHAAVTFLWWGLCGILQLYCFQAFPTLYLGIKFKIHNNSQILFNPVSRSLLPSCLTSVHSLFSSDVTFLTYFQFHKYIMNTLLSPSRFLSLSSFAFDTPFHRCVYPDSTSFQEA